MSGAYFPYLYHRGGCAAHGRGLSCNPRCVSAIYECRDHHCRSFRRIRQNRASICCQYSVYRHPDPAGPDPGEHGSWPERNLVEHYDFQYLKRNYPFMLVFEVFEKNDKNFLTPIGDGGFLTILRAQLLISKETIS